jgi:hypothetical protein
MAGSQSKQPETEHYASKSDADLSADVDQPVGFVNVLGTWVDQVGVVPPYRGRCWAPTSSRTSSARSPRRARTGAGSP